MLLLLRMLLTVAAFQCAEKKKFLAAQAGCDLLDHMRRVQLRIFRSHFCRRNGSGDIFRINDSLITACSTVEESGVQQKKAALADRAVSNNCGATRYRRSGTRTVGIFSVQPDHLTVVRADDLLKRSDVWLPYSLKLYYYRSTGL